MYDDRYVVRIHDEMVVAVPVPSGTDGVASEEVDRVVEEHFDATAASVSVNQDGIEWLIWAPHPDCNHNPYTFPPCAEWMRVFRRADEAVAAVRRALEGEGHTWTKREG